MILTEGVWMRELRYEDKRNGIFDTYALKVTLGDDGKYRAEVFAKTDNCTFAANMFTAEEFRREDGVSTSHSNFVNFEALDLRTQARLILIRDKQQRDKSS